MKKEILLRKQFKIIVSGETTNKNMVEVSTFNKNIESLGFTFSSKLMNRLEKLSVDELGKLYIKIIPIIQKMVGVKKYQPMYPNFPKQVMDMSNAELYSNAMLHYFSAYLQDIGVIDFTVLPKYEKATREALFEKTKLRIISEGTEQDLIDIFNNIVGANTSISETDKKYVDWFIKKDYQINKPILQKEQLALIVSSLITHKKDLTCLNQSAKTATDVLRIATAISGGDISLASNTRFVKFPRSQRRFLLSCLEPMTIKIEDMLKYANKWIALGEIIHPNQYQLRFPTTAQCFKVLREKIKVSTTNSQVEKFIKEGNIADAVLLLGNKKPGEFARRLDHLIRLSKDPARIVNEFIFTISNNKISTPVLLQLISHFSNRRDGKVIKTIFPKGSVSKMQVLETNVKRIGKQHCVKIVDAVKSQLVKDFKQLSSLGKIYLSDDLKNYHIPFGQRSASKALMTAGRGSRIPFGEDKNTIRFFSYWRDTDDGQRVDIDLSASLYTDDFGKSESLYWRGHLKNSFGCHSGDITSAPRGACEFIDINIDAALEADMRYVVCTLYSFTGKPFTEIPSCFCGWMLRDKPQSGEIFDAKTVQNKIDVTSNSTSCMPVIIDLLDRKVIWTDIVMKRNRFDSVGSSSNTIKLFLKGMVELKKPTVYDLLELHTNARGERVYDKDKANIVFDNDIALDQSLLSDYLV